MKWKRNYSKLIAAVLKTPIKNLLVRVGNDLVMPIVKPLASDHFVEQHVFGKVYSHLGFQHGQQENLPKFHHAEAQPLMLKINAMSKMTPGTSKASQGFSICLT